MLGRIKQFVDDFSPDVPEEGPSRVLFCHRQIKMILMTMKGFTESNIQLRASALTLYTVCQLFPFSLWFLALQRIWFRRIPEGI